MKQYLTALGLSILCLCVLCACGEGETVTDKEAGRVAASRVVEAEKEYDTQITGVVREIDENSSRIVIQETATAAETVLNYTDYTDAYNKYGDLKVVSQFSVGDIVEAYFFQENNELVRLENSPDAWVYEDVRNFKIQREDGILQISDKRYQFDNVSLIVSEDSGLIELLSINEKDQLTVQGIGSRIYSITVTKGHGYVRFKNYDQFIGGMVEVGYGTIRDVVEDMLLTVPEGDYRMVMEHGQLYAEKQITVEKGKELVLDLSDYQTQTEKTGKVYFSITPEGAQLNINGVPTVYTDEVELSYGKNIIQVTKEGYTSYTGTLHVRQAYQVVKINLAADTSEAEIVDTSNKDQTNQISSDQTSSSQEEPKDDLDDEADGNTDDTSEPSSENDNEDNDDKKDTEEKDNSNKKDNKKEDKKEEENTSIEAADNSATETDSKHTITVNSPTNVKVYVNDAYIGKSPVSFDKIIGTFIVALSKNGYQTASYTITMEDDGENSYLSFPELVEEGE